MTARTLATLQAAGRLLAGGGLTLAPGAVAGAWAGDIAHKRDTQVLAIGLGARDLAIAVGTLGALRRRRGAAAWVRAGLVADAADLAATLRSRDALPPLSVPAVVAIAGGSVLLGAYLQWVLD